MNIGLVVALLGLTSFALAILLVPLLLRRRSDATRDAYNLAVYRDQLAEVERDIGRGLVTTEQAEAARTEIGRRILALDTGQAEAAPRSAHSVVAIVAILLLPVVAWTIYWQLGSPTLPDRPFAASPGSEPTQPVAGDPSHIDMNEAIVKLTARLKEHPDDLTGWLLLARSQISVGQYKSATDAYQRAADLSGHRADIVGDWGEAQVMAAQGRVTPAARQAFEAALKDPETAPRSRYYLGLAQMQQGDAKGAVQAWRALEADSPADAEWLPLLRQRIAQAEAAPGPGAAPSAAAPANLAAVPPAGTSPDPQAVAAAAKATAGASPEQRQAMIRSMVDSLAARLASQPDDVEGWIRLGRSYMVLNQPDKARDAYARAIKLKPDEIGLKQAYAEAIVEAAGPDADAPPSEAIALYREILAAEPQSQEALWYVGGAEAAAGHTDQAHALWSQLLAQLPASSPEHDEVEKRLAALKPEAK